MTAWFGQFLAACGAALDGRLPLAASLFVAGLVGGVGHCAFMCGPFVLAQAGARLSRLPADRMAEWRRLTGAAVLPYHLGRLVTYSALGALAGGIAGTLFAQTWLPKVAGVLLFIAAIALAVQALGQSGWRLPLVDRLGELLATLARPLGADPTGWRGFGFGLVLGFLPCGLLYGTLAAAGSAGSALGGALLMASFALGTMPALILVGVAGSLAMNRWRVAAKPFVAALLLLNALVLVILAWRTLVG